MQVVILCGGLGTRLREETEFRPKPMVEIGARPVLWHIMSIYARFGYKDFVLPLGYKGEMIKQYFYDYKIQNSDFTVDLGSGTVESHESISVDWRVTLCDTGEKSLKTQRLLRVAKHLKGDNFMLTYGDGVADIDIERLVAHHKKNNKICTFTGVRIPSRFGTANTDARGMVLSWDEKPVLNEYINGGFFVFKREFLDYLSEDDTKEFEQDTFKILAANGELSMYPHPGRWECMDTLRDTFYLNDLWNSKEAFWTRSVASDDDV